MDLQDTNTASEALSDEETEAAEEPTPAEEAEERQLAVFHQFLADLYADGKPVPDNVSPALKRYYELRQQRMEEAGITLELELLEDSETYSLYANACTIPCGREDETCTVERSAYSEHVVIKELYKKGRLRVRRRSVYATLYEKIREYRDSSGSCVTLVTDHYTVNNQIASPSMYGPTIKKCFWVCMAIGVLFAIGLCFDSWVETISEFFMFAFLLGIFPFSLIWVGIMFFHLVQIPFGFVKLLTIYAEMRGTKGLISKKLREQGPGLTFEFFEDAALPLARLLLMGDPETCAACGVSPDQFPNILEVNYRDGIRFLSVEKQGDTVNARLKVFLRVTVKTWWGVRKKNKSVILGLQHRGPLLHNDLSTWTVTEFQG